MFTESKFENRLWEAMENDSAEVLRLLSDDCIMQFPNGRKVSATTKPSLKDTFSSDVFVPWTGHKMSDFEAMRTGRDGAVLTHGLGDSTGAGRRRQGRHVPGLDHECVGETRRTRGRKCASISRRRSNGGFATVR